MKLRNLDLPMAEIEAFCLSWKISELSLFGSVLCDDFRPDSDGDVLVTFAQDASWSLFEIFDVQEQTSSELRGSPALLVKAVRSGSFGGSDEAFDSTPRAEMPRCDAVAESTAPR